MWFTHKNSSAQERNHMKIAAAIALIGLMAMSAVLIYGFGVGNFSVEGARLMAMPWGIVSLVDL